MYQTLTTDEQLKQRAIKRAEALNAQSEDTGEIDGFKITAEQCRLINSGDRAAIDKFFEENKTRLKRLARRFLYSEGMPQYWDKSLSCWNPTIIEVGDCLNQLYVDMRRGFLVFALKPRLLGRVICHSFRYAGEYYSQRP